MSDLISRQAAIDALANTKDLVDVTWTDENDNVIDSIEEKRNIIANWLEKVPSAQPEVIRCKDCKHWRQQTNYQGAPLSFEFCESDDMWRSLYGETYEVSHIDTDDDFYCGHAERRTDERFNQQTGGD